MSETTASKRQSTAEERARALHQVLLNKKLVPDGYLESFTKQMEVDWDPSNGAKVVAHAWANPEFRALLLRDGTAACEKFGYTGVQGEYVVALENTQKLQNVIVCSLCSCTNWPVLGIPPEWYKSFEYRARMVREGRTVLRELGEDLPEDVTVQVWDTTAETRYMVLPMRPEGTEGWTEVQLATLVTKDVLIGTARPVAPALSSAS